MKCRITRNHNAHELKLGQHLHVKVGVEKYTRNKESRVHAASGVLALSKEGEPLSCIEKRWGAGIAFAAHAVDKFCVKLGPAHKKALRKTM